MSAQADPPQVMPTNDPSAASPAALSFSRAVEALPYGPRDDRGARARRSRLPADVVLGRPAVGAIWGADRSEATVVRGDDGEREDVSEPSGGDSVVVGRDLVDEDGDVVVVPAATGHGGRERTHVVQRSRLGVHPTGPVCRSGGRPPSRSGPRRAAAAATDGATVRRPWPRAPPPAPSRTGGCGGTGPSRPPGAGHARRRRRLPGPPARRPRCRPRWGRRSPHRACGRCHPPGGCR